MYSYYLKLRGHVIEVEKPYVRTGDRLYMQHLLKQPVKKKRGARS